MRSTQALDRFVSHFTSRLDGKGRVSIPASFRAVLAREGTDRLYLCPALDTPALDCGGQALLAEVDAMIAPLSPHSPERAALLLALLGESDLIKPDGEGRIVLTEALKRHAAVADEVTFVGLGTTFQIWEPNRFRLRLLEAREQARGVRNRLGSRSPVAGKPSPSKTGARE